MTSTNKFTAGYGDGPEQKDDWYIKMVQHGLVADESSDSEKSYEMLYTKRSISHKLTFLIFDIEWMFAVVLANVIIFGIHSYVTVFDPTFDDTVFVICLMLTCNAITVIDVIASIVHLLWKKEAAKKDLAPRSTVLITLDVITVLFMLLDVTRSLRDIETVVTIALSCVIFRLYRVINYFHVVSNTAGRNTLSILLKKYGIVLFLTVHSFSCIWYYQGCYKCPDKTEEDWTDNLADYFMAGHPTPGRWYVVSLYYMVQATTSEGIGDVHAATDIERLILIVVMLIGFVFMVAAFFGAWTSVQMESYRRHSEFSKRLKLIKEVLVHPRISKQLMKKIMEYYYTFWAYQEGILQSGLFDSLPRAIREQAHLDRCWHALNQSHLLKYTHEAFRREIASLMKTAIYTQGDIIYRYGKVKDTMVYIVRGSVQILSAEDGESPILTLGMGACLGEINLFYSFPNPVQVTASSYCVIHTLRKADFWRAIVLYTKLKQKSKLFEILKVKIRTATESQEEEAALYESSSDLANNLQKERALKMVKLKLPVESAKVGSSAQLNLKLKEAEARDSLQNVVYYDLYILSKHQTTLKNSDEIFLRTSWPWMLQPTSELQVIWEYFICITVTVVALFYPYQFAFVREFEPYMLLVMILIDLAYVTDIIVQIFTAIEDENGIITSIADILTIRCRSLSFLFDVISIIPIDYISEMLGITRSKRLRAILSANRLLKIHRVVRLLGTLSASFKVKVTLVRIMKYILYLLILAYFMGSLYYMLACFYVECLKESWFTNIKNEDLAVNGVRYMYPFELSLYFGILVISQGVYGDIRVYNVMEMIALIIFFITGTLIFSYLAADFSATLMLAERSRTHYVEMVVVIRNFLSANRMLRSVQRRMHDYLALQWRHNRGHLIRRDESVLHDLPLHLYDQQQAAKCIHMLASIPAFQGLEEKCVKMIAAKSDLIFLPPNEIVTYPGEVVRSMYMIEDGFCEMISSASGKVENLLGPGSHFNVFEMFLAQPGIFHIRTVTHVRIIQILYSDIKSVLTEYPEVQEMIQELATDIKGSMAVQRLFLNRTIMAYQDTEAEETGSWFIFPGQKLHPRHIDYEKGFANMGFWKFFKYFLLRRTILPDGNFIMMYEIFRACAALLSGILFPAFVIYKKYYWNTNLWFLILDGLGYVDIYIRLHVCFYTDKGILVTHPRYTGYYYLSRGLITDLCGLLPVEYIIGLMLTKEDDDQQSTDFYFTVQSLARFNRLLQMYRFPDAFTYFEKDILKPKGLVLNLMKFLPITLVFFNAFACFLILISSDMLTSDDGSFNITPDSDSWISHRLDQFSFDATQTGYTYMLAFYFTVTTTTSVGFGDLTAQTVREMLFTIINIIGGYLIFTYILIFISSSKASINFNLTVYQEHMKHLIQFMRREKINPELKTKVINHFEYVWQRTHGIKPSTILKRCYLALMEDCVLYLYEQTLMEVPIFADLNRSFYRLMGMHVLEKYYDMQSSIIRLNDIIDTVFIIHKGEVTVTAPDGSYFATLGKGCAFGNLDDTPCTRSMTTITSGDPVDLLYIKTEEMYTLAQDYPVVLNRLRRHLLTENLSYIAKTTSAKDDFKALSEEHWDTQDRLGDEIRRRKVNAKKLQTVIFSGPFQLLTMMMSFISCVITVYHLAFQHHVLVIFLIIYGIDIFHIINIYSGFHIPYRNKNGEMVTDAKQIRRRYLSPTRFYLDLLALLPLDLFALLVNREDMLYYLTWLRINRTLRVWNIYHFFDVTFDRLNINVFIIKVGSFCIYFILLVHTGACLLYMAGCPAGVCKTTTWVYNKHGEMLCKNHYMCSLKFMVEIITSTGFGDTTPRSAPGVILCTIVMILSKFIIAVFIGDISAMLQNYSYTLVNYDHNMATLAKYLKNGYVSEPLISRIMDYGHQLWDRDKGYQLPVLLQEAPSSLMQDVKAAAYGKHLYENYVFLSCHMDFLRLLIAKLKAETYFSGDFICQQGDINDTMYFIHKGIVEVLYITTDEEIQVDKLNELDCFGMVQGLFTAVPHSHTYKAVNVSVILTLKLSDWEHLLKFYPAAKFEIYSKIKNI